MFVIYQMKHSNRLRKGGWEQGTNDRINKVSSNDIIYISLIASVLFAFSVDDDVSWAEAHSSEANTSWEFNDFSLRLVS